MRTVIVENRGYTLKVKWKHFVLCEHELYSRLSNVYGDEDECFHFDLRFFFNFYKRKLFFMPIKILKMY